MRYLIFFCFYMLHGNAFGQKVVSGEVFDAVSNEPIKNVQIKVNEKDIKKRTNKKGKFEIGIFKERDSITFIAENYFPAKMVAKNAKKIKVMLYPMTSGTTSVDIGYGSQQASSMTSSVSVLTTEDFNQGGVIDIYDYLRGKVPGIYIQRSTMNPTDKPTILLRGGSGFGENSQPLIVIDGVQNASLDSVDPADVSSLTVLKDGSSAAIYGSQANGGVILISTKGKSKN